jgi:hypothetical protein
MYLDDDDMFVNSNSLDKIAGSVVTDDDLMLWRVDINGLIIPRDKVLGAVTAGNISGIGFMFNSKHLPINWSSWSFGDYRVISQLIAKGLNVVWIDDILTKTQGTPNHGRPPIQ